MTANPKFLRTAVLTMLNQTGDYKLPEEVIQGQVTRAFPAAASDAAAKALAWLHEKGFADYEVDHMTEEKRWKITESGKAQLR